ncbi:MAG: hypothetical protein U0Z53_19150 [Blastocatellia bacterium]
MEKRSWKKNHIPRFLQVPAGSAGVEQVGGGECRLSPLMLLDSFFGVEGLVVPSEQPDPSLPHSYLFQFHLPSGFYRPSVTPNEKKMNVISGRPVDC